VLLLQCSFATRGFLLVEAELNAYRIMVVVSDSCISLARADWQIQDRRVCALDNHYVAAPLFWCLEDLPGSVPVWFERLLVLESFLSHIFGEVRVPNKHVGNRLDSTVAV
jgi:hypothetical protein